MHRDLKPSNILVSNEGMPRLLDFGIAKILDPEGANTSVMMGTHMPLMTPEYASPEQLAGFGAGVRSDIYSLGLMLFELTTGKRPRSPEDSDWDGALPVPSEAIANTALPASGSPPSGLAPEQLSGALRSGLDEIVRRATARRPTDRYQLAQELIDGIALYLEANPSTAAGPAPPTRPRSRTRWWLGVAALSASAGIFLAIGPLRWLPPGSPRTERTVRVEPFTNLNGDEATARFARTLNDELVTELTEVGWKVTREGGAVQLEGSVRAEAGGHRVSARLMKPGDQSVTWARAFEGNRENDLARLIAGTLGKSRPEVPVSAEASATLVEGYTHLRWAGAPEEAAQSRERISRAIATFEKATRAPPRFARASAGLAAAEAQMADHWDHPVYTDWIRKAEASARKALDLDPTLDEALGTLGMALYFGRHDFKGALDAFARAAEFNPRSSTSHRLLADLFCLFNRYDEAVAELLRAQSLDPADPDMVAHEALVRFWRRQFPEAEIVARRAVAAKPDYWYGHWALGLVLPQRKRFVEAEKELREAQRLPSPGTRTITALGHFLAETGRRAEAEEVLGAIKARAQGSLRRYVYSEAMIRAGLGETEAALALLEKSYEIGDLSLPYTKLDPRMDSLKGPRYSALMKKLGLPE